MVKAVQLLIGFMVFAGVSASHASNRGNVLMECTNVRGTVKISKSELTVSNRSLDLRGVTYKSRSLFTYSSPDARYSLEIAGSKHPISISKLRTDECGNKGFRRIYSFDVVLKDEAKRVLLEDTLICDQGTFEGVCE